MTRWSIGVPQTSQPTSMTVLPVSPLSITATGAGMPRRCRSSCGHVGIAVIEEVGVGQAVAQGRDGADRLGRVEHLDGRQPEVGRRMDRERAPSARRVRSPVAGGEIPDVRPPNWCMVGEGLVPVTAIEMATSCPVARAMGTGSLVASDPRDG